VPAKKASKKRTAKKSAAKRSAKKSSRASKATKTARSTKKATKKTARKATKKSTAKKASRRVGKSKIPGISRIDQESTRTHGWFVRVGYRRTKQGWRPKHRAFFGDKSHGGKSSALKAAEVWLNSVKES
jgi:hypothetical protein